MKTFKYVLTTLLLLFLHTGFSPCLFSTHKLNQNIKESYNKKAIYHPLPITDNNDTLYVQTSNTNIHGIQD